MKQYLLKFKIFYLILTFFFFLFFFILVLENTIIFLDEKNTINIIILQNFSQENCTKEEKFIKYIIYDSAKLWAVINSVANEYKELHRDELISEGISPEPEDENYFSFYKFSSYSQFGEYLKEKYSSARLNNKNKLLELRNIVTFYWYNYKDKCLEMYDLYVFEDKIIIVTADDSDKKFLMESEEAASIEEIFIKKQESFKDIILENNTKKKNNWFIVRSTDKELALRIKLIYKKIVNS